MYKTVLNWVLIMFFVNLFLIACSNQNTPKVYNNSVISPKEDVLLKENDYEFVDPNKFTFNCDLDKINDFTRQYCDEDNDGLLNIQEAKYKTDPFNADTDNDGYFDGEEVKKHYNPLGFGDFVPDKFKNCENPRQAWCWAEQAFYRADPKICNNIEDSAYLKKKKEKCIEDAEKELDKIKLEIALADLNYNKCNEIKDENILKECQKELALALGAVHADPNFCLETFGFSKIKKDEKISHEKELQHRCWYAMAIASDDIEACKKLDYHVIKDFDSIACLSQIARLHNNPKLCNKLKEWHLEQAIPRCLGAEDIPNER